MTPEQANPTAHQGRNEGNMYGYIAFFKGQRHELYTDKGIYHAQLLAADHFKVPRKKSHLVHVGLAELPGGVPYIQTAVD